MSDKSNKCEHYYDGLCMCNPILNDCGVLLGYEECNKISNRCIRLTGQLLQTKHSELRNKHDKEKLNSKLQQLKAENEKLCTAIRNELPEQYDKRVSEAEGDIEWGVLNRNATETEFCKNVILETRNHIAKLKAENKELKENYRLSCLKCKFKNAFMILDEIEEIVNKYDIVNPNTIISNPLEELCQILQKIKEVKENER